ncbi:MAG: hypothetical protein JXQ87_00540 [Bacteroidia bacterium]
MKVETYILKEWEESTAGLLLAEDKEWILVKHIPVDYAIDGYRIYKKEFVEKRERTDAEKQIERVLALKGIKSKAPVDFEFSNTVGLIKWVESNYGLFEFQDDDESEIFYGQIDAVNGNGLTIKLLAADGSIDTSFNYEFDISRIRVLEFETDYHLSMKLLLDDNKQQTKNDA